jgi:hypothetical protein
MKFNDAPDTRISRELNCARSVHRRARFSRWDTRVLRAAVSWVVRRVRSKSAATAVPDRGAIRVSPQVTGERAVRARIRSGEGPRAGVRCEDERGEWRGDPSTKQAQIGETAVVVATVHTMNTGTSTPLLREKGVGGGKRSAFGARRPGLPARSSCRTNPLAQ